MADAAAVLGALDADLLPRLRVLVPNLHGLDLALEHGVGNVVVTIGATDSFNQANVNRSVAESLTELADILTHADSAGCRVDVALSVCFGCPYEGAVDPDRVVQIAKRLIDLGVVEVGIADTIGVATPPQVRDLCERVGDPAGKGLSLHVHDTRGLGVANVLAGYAAGVRRFDGSAGGVGGCPFAPRSTGNVCSEDALQALVAEGADSGVDLRRLCAASATLASDLSAELPGKLYRAGMWTGEPLEEMSSA